MDREKKKSYLEKNGLLVMVVEIVQLGEHENSPWESLRPLFPVLLRVHNSWTRQKRKKVLTIQTFESFWEVLTIKVYLTFSFNCYNISRWNMSSFFAQILIHHNAVQKFVPKEQMTAMPQKSTKAQFCSLEYRNIRRWHKSSLFGIVQLWDNDCTHNLRLVCVFAFPMI